MAVISPRSLVQKSSTNVSSPEQDQSMSNNTTTSRPRASASAPITKLSISRNYTIPPRPKPGRKPNADVPPSRRKAQNREAQRAFRERKSQAVRLLEAQLAQQALVFERQQEKMKEQIEKLQKQNMRLQSSPEQSPGQSLNSPGNSPSTNLQTYGQTMQTSPIVQSPASAGTSPSDTHRRKSSFGSAYFAQSPQSPGSSPFGTPITPADFVGLELLDHVLEQKLPTDDSAGSPGSTTTITSPKQHVRRMSRTFSGGREVVRTDPPLTNNPLDLVNTDWSQPAVPLRRPSKALEVDYTLAFTPREQPRVLTMTARSPPSPRDRCGFCTDNSVCICAVSAAREEGTSTELAPDIGQLGTPQFASQLGSPLGSPLGRLSIEGAPASPPTSIVQPPQPPAGECSGNPGNCSQCRQDPMLTLFCSAVSTKPATPKLSTSYSTYIPAQAAYKTLSRHPRFGYADLGMIVDALQVRSSQVEVNSVAKVLRILDTR